MRERATSLFRCGVWMYPVVGILYLVVARRTVFRCWRACRQVAVRRCRSIAAKRAAPKPQFAAAYATPARPSAAALVQPPEGGQVEGAEGRGRTCWEGAKQVECSMLKRRLGASVPCLCHVKSR